MGERMGDLRGLSPRPCWKENGTGLLPTLPNPLRGVVPNAPAFGVKWPARLVKLSSEDDLLRSLNLDGDVDDVGCTERRSAARGPQKIQSAGSRDCQSGQMYNVTVPWSEESRLGLLLLVLLVTAFVGDKKRWLLTLLLRLLSPIQLELLALRSARVGVWVKLGACVEKISPLSDGKAPGRWSRVFFSSDFRAKRQKLDYIQTYRISIRVDWAHCVLQTNRITFLRYNPPRGHQCTL